MWPETWVENGWFYASLGVLNILTLGYLETFTATDTAIMIVNHGKEIDPEKDTDGRIRQVNIIKNRSIKIGNANISKVIGFSYGKSQRRVGCNVR